MFCVKEKIKTYLYYTFDDKNTMSVFASKGTQVAYLNSILNNISVQLIHIVHSKNKSIVDMSLLTGSAANESM